MAQRVVLVVMLWWMISTGAYFTVVRPLLAQATEDQISDLRTDVAVNRTTIETLNREVALIRALNIDARLSNLESTVVEVKWLGRTAASVLLGQLLLAILASRKKV